VFDNCVLTDWDCVFDNCVLTDWDCVLCCQAEVQSLFGTPGAAAATVRLCPGRGFCFVDFPDPAAALAALAVGRAATPPLQLHGCELSLGWADSARGGGATGALLTDPPAADSRVLFVGGLSPEVTAAELGALFGRVLSVPAGSVTVRRPAGRPFAFVQLSSHSLAAAAVARAGEELRPLEVGWARVRAGDSGGGDCWFCLSSPSVKVRPSVCLCDVCCVYFESVSVFLCLSLCVVCLSLCVVSVSVCCVCQWWVCVLCDCEQWYSIVAVHSTVSTLVSVLMS
jgi:hypothetical protein